MQNLVNRLANVPKYLHPIIKYLSVILKILQIIDSSIKGIVAVLQPVLFSEGDIEQKPNPQINSAQCISNDPEAHLPALPVFENHKNLDKENTSHSTKLFTDNRPSILHSFNSKETVGNESVQTPAANAHKLCLHA